MAGYYWFCWGWPLLYFPKKYPLPMSHLLRRCIMKNSRQIWMYQIDLLQLLKEITRKHKWLPAQRLQFVLRSIIHTGKHKEYPRQELERTAGKVSSYFLFKHDHLYKVFVAEECSKSLLCPPLGWDLNLQRNQTKVPCPENVHISVSPVGS